MLIIKKITQSFSELKSIRPLALTAMLLALRVVLGFFANATLPLFAGSVKISGAFLPVAAAAVLLGPVPAAIVGAAGDVLSFIIAPTGAYFPGFTLNGFLTGFIYGMFFYENKVTAVRTAAAWLVNALCVETFLHALWLCILYGSGTGEDYFAYLTARLISEGVKLLPEIILIFIVNRAAVGILHGSSEKRGRPSGR